MNLDGAWQAIDDMLERAIARGERVVLLITGHHRPGEPPIARGKIRAAVHDWLAASGMHRPIAAVRGAHRRHGGSGSLYLVLGGADHFLPGFFNASDSGGTFSVAWGATRSHETGTAQKISNAILSCADGAASFCSRSRRCSTSPSSTPRSWRRSSPGRSACCQLHGRRTPDQRKLRALNALSERLLAIEDGDLIRPLLRPYGESCPNWRRQWTLCSPKCARRSKMRMHLACTIRDLTAQPAAFPFGSRQVAQRSGRHAPDGDAVRRSRPLKMVNDSLGHARGDSC